MAAKLLFVCFEQKLSLNFAFTYDHFSSQRTNNWSYIGFYAVMEKSVDIFEGPILVFRGTQFKLQNLLKNIKSNHLTYSLPSWRHYKLTQEYYHIFSDISI